MSNLWTEEEEKDLKTHIKMKSPLSYIHSCFVKSYESNIFGYNVLRSEDSINRKINRIKEVGLDIRKETDLRWKNLFSTWEKYKEEEVAIEPYYENDIKRFILSLSDLHLPVTPINNIYNILDEHKSELKKYNSCIVLNGDILDEYSASNFGKFKKIAIYDEYKMALDLIDICLDYTDEVYLVRGNHEKRLSRMLHESIDDEASSMFNSDLLTRLSNGEKINDFGLVTELKSKFKNRVFYSIKEPWYCRIGQTMFVHPSGFKSGLGGTVKEVCNILLTRYDTKDFDSVVCGHCFDENTDILTKDGWKNINNISINDKPISMNKDSNNLEEDNINGIHQYDNYNELIYFGSDNKFQIAVTPEHGMIYKRSYNKKNNNWIYDTAENIFKRSNIAFPVSGFERSNIDLNIDDNLLKLLAWIITEGNLENIKNNKFGIRISQSDSLKKSYLNEIENILNNLNIKFTKSLRYKANTTVHGTHRNYDAYRYYIGREYSDLISKYLNINNKTFGWELINKLSLRQRLLLIEELCKGDGSKCGRKDFCHYYTKSKILRDQFQYLLTVSGFRNNYGIKKDKTFYINFSKKQSIKLSNFKKQKYNGKVWCLSVNNGTLIARRNGYVFITQNTHQQIKAIHSGKLLIEQGALCGYLPYEYQDDLKFKSAINGYAVIYQDSKGNTNFSKSNFIHLGSRVPTKKKILF